MMLIETLNDWAGVWGPFAARSLVDASLVLAIVGVVWLLFHRRMSSQLGYCLFLLVPVKLLVPLEIPVPGWIGNASPGVALDRIVARRSSIPARPISADLVSGPQDQPGEAIDFRHDSTASAVAPSVGLSKVALLPPRTKEGPRSDLSTGAKLMIAWSAIVLGFMFIFVYTHLRLCKILFRAELLKPGTLPVDLGELKRLVGVRRSIRLLVSPAVSSPAVHGLVRPSVLLPPDFVESVSPAQIRFVLLHELAHVGRGDLWVATFQRIVQMIYFFNPAVWIANWLIDQQREYARDDVALSAGGVSRRESGEAFVRIVERVNSRKRSLDPALGIFMPKHFFRRRLMRIMDAKRPIHPKLTLGSATVAVAMAMILLPHLRAIEQSIDENAPAVSKMDAAADADKTGQEAADAKSSGLRVSTFGRVVDGDGKPMAGVTVYVRDWPMERVDAYFRGPLQEDILATTRTDEGGNFRLEDVSVPPIRRITQGVDLLGDVVAVAKGYAMAWQNLPTATNGEPVRLTLVPESRVSGRIIDNQGEPIEDALVRVQYVSPLDADRFWGFEEGHLSLYLSKSAPAAKSDRNGRVSIDNMPSDKWVTLTVDHEDYRSAYVHVATTETAQREVEFSTRYSWRKSRQEIHSRNFSLTMEPSGPRLSGRITFADSGKPDAGTSVRLVGEGYEVNKMTDEDGRYVFKDTSGSECRMTVTGPKETDYLGRHLRLTLPEDGSDMEFDLELPIGQIATGSVVDEESDEGIAGILVASRPSWGKETTDYFGRMGVTDEQGNFRVAVPPGRSMLTISGSGNDYDITSAGMQRNERPDARYVRMIEVTEDRPLDNVRFWLSRGLVINGVVIDADGKPVDGATVKTVRRKQLHPGEQGKLVNSFRYKKTQTDEKGRFTMSGYPAVSRCYLDVMHQGRLLYGTIAVDADERARSPRIVPVEAKLTAAAAIQGQVLVDGEPSEGTYVVLHRNIAKGSGRSDETLEKIFPDAEGRYTFKIVPTGDKIRVSAFGDIALQRFTWCESDELVLKPGQICELPILTIRHRNATVSGIVVQSDGKPIEGARVDAINPIRKDKYRTSTSTDQDGHFTIQYVPNGLLRIKTIIQDASQPRGITISSPIEVEVNGNVDDIRIVTEATTESAS
jgi:beta-lactamase regulating signal transducer with metallopeptidase domain/uncharacterized GH25 family protein